MLAAARSPRLRCSPRSVRAIRSSRAKAAAAAGPVWGRQTTSPAQKIALATALGLARASAALSGRCLREAEGGQSAELRDCRLLGGDEFEQRRLAALRRLDAAPDRRHDL